MTRTILLADDSVTIQKVVELTFLDEEIRVVSVGNGTDAIAKLGELRPDLVLADVHMPGADGYEVCNSVRERAPGVPVLLLVGTFELFDNERATAVGASGHMKKPFDSQELLRRVRELLAETPEAELSAAPSWSAAAAAEPFSPSATVAMNALSEDDWGFEPVGEPEPAAEAPILAPATSPEYVDFEPSNEPAIELARSTESTPALEPEPKAAPALPSSAPFASSTANATAELSALSADDVERIARRVVELISEKMVRDVAWDVVPDLAELLLKERIRELEASVE